MSSKQELVDTLSAMQMNNGMVRMYFVAQDPEELMEGKDPQRITPELRQCVAMPLPGFLYAMTVIDNFLKDERMQNLIANAKDSGAIPETLDLSAVLRPAPEAVAGGGKKSTKSKAA